MSLEKKTLVDQQTGKSENKGQIMSFNVIAVTPHQTSVFGVRGPRF